MLTRLDEMFKNASTLSGVHNLRYEVIRTTKLEIFFKVKPKAESEDINESS